MAQPKTWTATNLALGSLTIRRQEVEETGAPGVRFEQRYQFEDAGGEILQEIGTGRLAGVMPVADIPQSILDALTTIDNWLYQQCLEKEGMQDAS